MGRQGIKRTTKAVLLAGVIVATADRGGAAVPAAGCQRPRPAGRLRHDVDRQPLDAARRAAVGRGRRGLSPHNYGLKSGGFVGAAYIGMFMGDPYQVVVAFTVALRHLSSFVKYVLMNDRSSCSAAASSRRCCSPRRSSRGRCCGRDPSFFSASVTDHLDLASHGTDPVVRARPAGQRHGPHQPDPRGGRRRIGRRVRGADHVVDPVDRRRSTARPAMDPAGASPRSS